MPKKTLGYMYNGRYSWICSYTAYNIKKPGNTNGHPWDE